MKRFFFFMLTGLLFMSVQATLLGHPPIQRWRPDLMLILVLYLGFSLPLSSGGILAFIMGFLMDLFSGNALGLYTLTRPLAFLTAQLFRNRFYWQGISFQFLFVTLASLLEGLFILFLLTALTPSTLKNLYPLVLTHLLPQSFCTGGVTLLLFSFLKKGTELLRKEEERTGLRIEG
jgi:rod shape-determining protein MreD